MPVLVFSGGEPFCRQDLFHLVDKARQQGIIPALATNGTTINDDRARQIRDSGVARVSVSLDGATADVHDRMRQIPGAFDRAIAGIRHLHHYGVPFQINVTLTKQNAGQLEDIYELARSLGAVAVHIFMLVPVGCGETLAQTDMLSPQQYEQIMRDICALEARGQIQIKVTCGPHYERVKREQGLHKTQRGANHSGDGRDEGVPGSPTHNSALGVPVPPSNRGQDARDTGNHRQASLDDVTPTGGHVPKAPGHGGHSRGCLAGLGVLFVSHRGDVYPCGYLPVDCGNILKETLTEIWDGNKDLARMRNAAALEGKCGVCGYKLVCGGCRARAFGMTGSYMAEEPFCVYNPPRLRMEITD
jgi:radical SAM protein with 4Fe4S-binding SPASM domain